jgi:hypothetical protein
VGAAVRADRFAVRRQNGRIPAPRTFDAVCDAIAQALTTIPPAEGANYLAGAEYASA